MDRFLALTLLIAVAQARFGQEQVPIQAIAQVQGGAPGAAATIAGATISDLLGGANPCAKLSRADQIVTELGGGADAIAAAQGLVAAEKNTNPFAVDIPPICSDPTLPATPELRGITPLIDPDTANAAVANALSASSLASPLDATGKSIADLLAENGFTDFTPTAADGTAGAAPAAGAGADAGADAGNGDADVPPVVECDAGAGAVVGNNTGNNANAGAGAAHNAGMGNEQDIGNGNAGQDNDNAGQDNDNAGQDNDNAGQDNDNAGQDNGNAGQDNGNADAGNAAAGGNDFGTCDPTISFEGGRNGRPATEFTFQSNDPAIEANQQEALNPNIITNRICDELINICGANDAAQATCQDAEAQIQALGTRDQTTADAWNALVGGGAAKRSMRRGARL